MHCENQYRSYLLTACKYDCTFCKLTSFNFHFSDNLEWEEHSAAEPKSLYERTDLHLISGAMYTIRVGVTNNAGVMAIHETNGIRLDLTAPKVFHCLLV